LDEPVERDDRIKALQKQIDDLKRQHREEQIGLREAIKDQVGDIRSLQADERRDRKNAILEQIDEIKRLHEEQQACQKALLDQVNEMKQLERAERKENKKGLRLGLALKLGKPCDRPGGHAEDLHSLMEHGDPELRKGFLKQHILLALSVKPAHGYELMHLISHHTGHAWTPSPGSMYPALDSLTSKGFIACQGDGRRKVYSLTPKGQEVLAQMKKKRDEQFFEMKSFMSALFDE